MAFSGGVDSAFLVYAAHEALGGKLLAITVTTQSYPRHEAADAAKILQSYGVKHAQIELNQLAIPGFCENGAQRCYYCKYALFTKIKEAAQKQGISQAELASKLGVTQQAVGKWESGKSSPDPSTVARIAELLNTTADYLLGLYRPVSNVSAPEERFFGSYSESLIPVIGTVKAGYGALAFEEDYGQEYARVKDPSNYFYLVVRGDSMEPRIQDGDLALVHKQDTLETATLAC